MKNFLQLSFYGLFIFFTSFHIESLSSELHHTTPPSIEVSIETKNCDLDLKYRIENYLKSEISKRIDNKSLQINEQNNTPQSHSSVIAPKSNTTSIICNGTVTLNEYTVGQEQLNKYVIKDIIKQEFVIDITISVNGKTTSTQKKFTDISALDETLNQFVQEIAGFYEQQQMSPTQSQQVLVNEKSISNQLDATISAITLRSFSTSIIYAKPVGYYASIIEYGYGVSVSVQYLIPSFIDYIDISALVIKYNPKSIAIKQYSATLLSFSAGYEFNYFNRFTTTLSAGGGYYISVINGTKDFSLSESNYSNEIYYNPAITAGIAFQYKILHTTNILLNSSYTYFFEQHNIGKFITIGVGVLMMF